MAKVESKIDRDSQDRIRIEKLKKASMSLSDKVAKWKKMDLLIGDAKGNNFSNFAQALTLQNLLVYANKRIQKLTDRYLIVPPEKEGTLRVLDLYHGNISRSVATLSGGETFLVSLALALSLSDMASKTVSIDSLFIDEGFSTLDKDAQQMALDTLDNLQSVSQKTIGVISHVEALKSRINVQIQLDKNAQGYSSLKVSDGSAE
jgi:exonuclease SbcC